MINNICKEVIRRFNVNKFIETGVFMGDTLMIVQDWFCELYGDEFNTGPWNQGQKGKYRIYEIEINKEYLDKFVYPRAQSQINTIVAHSDSVEFLTKAITNEEFSNKDKCFFYLDAHSDISKPLHGEIRQILHLNHQIICCDDWSVPEIHGDEYNTEMIRDLIKDRTDVVYYTRKHNYHGKYSIFVFLDYYEKELDKLLKGLDLVKEKIK